MTLGEMGQRLKTVSSYDKAIFALFRYLKDNKEIILDYNREQLFLESMGSDGRALGFYAQQVNPDPNDPKQPDEPFSMVDSGLFKQGLYIEFFYRHIIIRSHYHTFAMQNNPAFETTEFFGLTEQNMERLIEFTVKPFMIEWIRQHLSSGANLTPSGTVTFT